MEWPLWFESGFTIENVLSVTAKGGNPQTRMPRRGEESGHDKLWNGEGRRQRLKSGDFSGKRYRMSRVYEVMFIVRPDVAEEDADKLIAGFSATVTGGGGVVKSVEKMGRRKLAYMVRKFNDGNYVLLTIEANGPVVLELERRLRVSEPVIKFITVRMDEEEKRLAKVKALRGTRRKVSAEPAAHAAPAAAPVATAAPAEAAEPVQASA